MVHQNEKLRIKNFQKKFESASNELDAESYHEIESLKFRSTQYYGYRELLARFRNEMGVVEVKGNYQGNAWKVSDKDGHSVLIVEHETGLEILYVIGAVASVLEIIWKVASLWNRSSFRHFPSPEFDRFEMESRRFDNKGRLIEGSAPPLDTLVISNLLSEYADLSTRVSKIEEYVTEMHKPPKEGKKNGE